MILKNESKQTIVTKNLKEAQSIIDKIFGLLRKSNPRSLLFKTRFGIHTFFLKEPIDVLVLNKNWLVAKTATVKPNRILIYNPTHEIVIELPNQSILKSNTEIGDKLQLK